jgi:beta-glucanase (GH16 family)
LTALLLYKDCKFINSNFYPVPFQGAALVAALFYPFFTQLIIFDLNVGSPMKHLLTSSAFLCALVLSGFLSKLTAQSCYELVWSDEFNYTGLPDSTLWTHEVGASGWGNNELQYYTKDRLENARVEDGHLIVEARKEEFLGADYTSARLITYENGHSFTYGKIEASIKLPFGQGIWPAFWMLGDGIFEGTPWPACGEIDIMEMVGGGDGKDDVVHGTVHWSDAGGNPASYGGDVQLDQGIFADTFHVFSIEWDATSIKWFLDGVQYHVVDITPAHMSEFQKDFHILLNVAVGGNWPGSPDASTVFPQRMYVDYVRVYQLDATPEILGDTLVNAAEKGLRFSTVESDSFTYAWSVPADALIVEGQGTNSILVDWGCDTGTVSCNLSTPCGQYDLTYHIGLDSLEIAGKDIVEFNQTGLTYAIPPTREAIHQWILPEGVILNSKNDSNAVNIDWYAADGELSVQLSNFCGTDSASKPVSAIRQAPYPDPEQPHKIPGTIESVNYDSGGEGISYHDTEPENLGPGSRQDEGVDTEFNDGGENIGWLEPGEWLEYTVEVESTGLYDIDVRVASTNSLGKFKLLFNGEDRTGEVSVPQTGAWSAFTTITLNDIPLSGTDSLMRIHIVNGLFNMGRLLFAPAPTSPVEDVLDTRQVSVYPTLTRQRIFVKGITSVHTYYIADMMGRIWKSGRIRPEGFIPVEDLNSGAYIVILKGDRTLFSGRFLKAD